MEIVSRPVVSRLPAQLDRFACRQLDKVSHTAFGLASIGSQSDLIYSQFGLYAGGPAPALATPTPPNPEDPDNPHPPPHSSEGEHHPQSLEADLNSTHSPRSEPGPAHSSGSEPGPAHPSWHGASRPHSPGSGPGPVRPSDSRMRPQIIGGFIIPYSECLLWLDRKFKISLNPDHSEDLTIPWHLEIAMNERGHNWDIEFSQRGDGNFLLVTQRIHGQFKNLGPEGEEEVLQVGVGNAPPNFSPDRRRY